ncbi:MAG: FHA domain-containing protein [Proteobacteria bacterium]|nr:FHA domain-containing protein [Pseudomonadota bacterium]
MKTHAQPARGHAIRKVRVRVLEGADAGATCEAQSRKALAIGSAPDNDLVLRDPSVSRYHLELGQAQDGIQIVDLGSRNGTHLRELRIERAVVPPGTRVLVGRTLLALEDGAAARSDEGTGRRRCPG